MLHCVQLVKRFSFPETLAPTPQATQRRGSLYERLNSICDISYIDPLKPHRSVSMILRHLPGEFSEQLITLVSYYPNFRSWS